MSRVTALWRHPIKSAGREPLSTVKLTAGCSMPFDRLWAIAHDAAKCDGKSWAPCQNFSRGAQQPSMMAITAKLDEATETLTLSHPLCSDLVVHPDSQQAELVRWLVALTDPSRAQPALVYRLDGRGFTDTPFASVSLCNRASHAAVEALAHAPLQHERWRGNVWFDGTVPWEEFDWLGRELRIGGAVLKVKERITRCKATTVNTDTGLRDVDTLTALKTLGHQDFGVYASVVQTGVVSVDDRLELI